LDDSGKVVISLTGLCLRDYPVLEPEDSKLPHEAEVCRKKAKDHAGVSVVETQRGKAQ